MSYSTMPADVWKLGQPYRHVSRYNGTHRDRGGLIPLDCHRGGISLCMGMYTNAWESVRGYSNVSLQHTYLRTSVAARCQCGRETGGPAARLNWTARDLYAPSFARAVLPKLQISIYMRLTTHRSHKSPPRVSASRPLPKAKPWTLEA